MPERVLATACTANEGALVASNMSLSTGMTLDYNNLGNSPEPSFLMQSAFAGGSDRLSELLACVPAVTYECDSNLSVVIISSNALDLLGIASDQLLGRRALWQERLCTDDRARIIALLENLELGQTAALIHRLLDDRGLPVWVSHSFRKLRRNGGGIVCGCLLPIPRDVCTQYLDSATIAQFVHKMGNHFQLINLLMGPLKRSGAGPSELDAIQQAVDRTVEFTRTLMNFAQALACPSNFDLGEALKSVLYSLASTFADKKVSLQNRVDEYFNGTMICGDPFLLELAFDSVLQNALEATKSGGEVRVSAKCERSQLDSRLRARIVIEDTGCGMNKDVLPRAVVPFFTSCREKNGLGLSMAVRIIEQHGGLLHITSAEGQGTAVHITLPVSRATSSHDR
jgi:signal transduction histidine kinase